MIQEEACHNPNATMRGGAETFLALGKIKHTIKHLLITVFLFIQIQICKLSIDELYYKPIAITELFTLF